MITIEIRDNHVETSMHAWLMHTMCIYINIWIERESLHSCSAYCLLPSVYIPLLDLQKLQEVRICSSLYSRSCCHISTHINHTLLYSLNFALPSFNFNSHAHGSNVSLHLIEFNPGPSCTQLDGTECYYSLQITMFDDIAGYIYVTCSIKLVMFTLAT